MSTFSTAALRLPAGSLHFQQTKVPLTFTRLPFTPEQRLWTLFLHFVQVTELFSTPFPHIPHGHLLRTSSAFIAPLIITLVFATFTFIPFLSITSFHFCILLIE